MIINFITIFTSSIFVDHNIKKFYNLNKLCFYSTLNTIRPCDENFMKKLLLIWKIYKNNIDKKIEILNAVRSNAKFIDINFFVLIF